ncbi:hypothetical protein [Prosthecobacter sp.]|uniref:hypothetical protein n=1 Tax=Prosthecobacter sp. TaxID=1965333 RepID=UPI0037847686
MDKHNDTQKLRWPISEMALILFGIVGLAWEGVAAWNHESCDLMILGMCSGSLGVGLALLRPAKLSFFARLGALGFLASLLWFNYEEWQLGRTERLFCVPFVIFTGVSLIFIIWGSHPKMIALLESMGDSESCDFDDWD